ncbi:MAG: DUF1552 domain-containing protein [Polyangiaceae bacterium]|nr:DUF1552 domain-containing protein [Polyangiaceae bacterium]
MTASIKYPRRGALRAAGALIAFPWLEAFRAEPIRAADPLAPVRFMAWFHTSGALMEHWTPAQTGTLAALGPTLAPLEPYKQDLLVLSGLSIGDGSVDVGSHEGGQRAFLTAHNEPIAGQTQSIDQIIAEKLGALTRFPSLQLSIEQNTFYDPSTDANNDGYKDSPTSSFNDATDYCSDANCMVAFNKGSMLPNLYNPRLVFEKLFGAMDTGSTVDSAAAARRVNLRKSVLDYVSGRASDLKTKVGLGDQRRLDEYLDGIRQIEKGIDSQSSPSVGCTPGVKPMGIPTDPQKTLRLMADLSVKAFQCDATRSITMMLGQGLSAMKFAVNGVTYAHHNDASHHLNDPVKMKAKDFIDTWQVAQLAYMLEQLKNTSEGSGKLIDNVVLFYSSDVSDPNLHGNANMPVLVAGRGGGAITTGRHVAGLSGRTTGDLFLEILKVFGVEMASIGRFGKQATQVLA